MAGSMKGRRSRVINGPKKLEYGQLGLTRVVRQVNGVIENNLMGMATFVNVRGHRIAEQVT